MSLLVDMNNVVILYIICYDNMLIFYVNWDNMGVVGGIVFSINDMFCWLGS